MVKLVSETCDVCSERIKKFDEAVKITLGVGAGFFRSTESYAFIHLRCIDSELLGYSSDMPQVVMDEILEQGGFDV